MVLVVETVASVGRLTTIYWPCVQVYRRLVNVLVLDFECPAAGRPDALATGLSKLLADVGAVISPGDALAHVDADNVILAK